MDRFFLEIDGMQVNYYMWGNNNLPTIVCLHGLAGSATYSFSQLHNSLSEHFNLIAIDQPGHGRSKTFTSEKDYLFSNLAKWYEKVFDQILSKPFYLLGHSWGADVVLHYTKHYPTNVKGIILLDGGFTFPEYQEEMTFSTAYNGWSQYMNNATFDNWIDIVNQFKHYTKKWNMNLEQELATIFTKNNQKFELIASKFTVLSIIKAFFEEPFSTTYPFIKVPLLLIHAKEPKDLDSARKLGISQIKKDIKDVSIIAMSDTGHMVQWDKPNAVAVEIKSWVNSKEDNTTNRKVL